MSDPTLIDELHDATGRLVRAIDAMTDEQYAEPSLLPDWSRAHVIAHLALNAEGLGAALGGTLSGRKIPMYGSQDERDGDIETLAESTPSILRGRLLGSTADLSAALAAMPGDPDHAAWATKIERTPGSERTFSGHAVPQMRLREVEIHHADLLLDYAHTSWPTTFSGRLLDHMVKRGGWAEPFTLDPIDLGGTWRCGADVEPGPVLTGTAADLGWWLTGRGSGAGVTSESGVLPRIEAW